MEYLVEFKLVILNSFNLITWILWKVWNIAYFIIVVLLLVDIIHTPFSVACLYLFLWSCRQIRAPYYKEFCRRLSFYLWIQYFGYQTTMFDHIMPPWLSGDTAFIVKELVYGMAAMGWSYRILGKKYMSNFLPHQCVGVTHQVDLTTQHYNMGASKGLEFKVLETVLTSKVWIFIILFTY